MTNIGHFSESTTFTGERKKTLFLPDHLGLPRYYTAVKAHSVLQLSEARQLELTQTSSHSTQVAPAQHCSLFRSAAVVTMLNNQVCGFPFWILTFKRERASDTICSTVANFLKRQQHTVKKIKNYIVGTQTTLLHIAPQSARAQLTLPIHSTLSLHATLPLQSTQGPGRTFAKTL